MITNSDREQEKLIIEAAKMQLESGPKVRWLMLAMGGCFLSLCLYALVKVNESLERLQIDQVTDGFHAGFVLSWTCAIFGTMGGVCIAKCIQGLVPDNRKNKLLVEYYERLQGLSGKGNE